MMHRLRETNDFTVVDLWPHFNDVSLALLDMSDVILTVLTLEITNIKNVRLFLEVAEQLGYGDRLKLVLNRADSAFGIRVADVENSVGRKIDHQPTIGLITGWSPVGFTDHRSDAPHRAAGARDGHVDG